MLLKEIGRKIAQAFRLARAADEKVANQSIRNRNHYQCNR